MDIVYLPRGLRARIDCPYVARPPESIIVWLVNGSKLNVNELSADAHSLAHTGSLIIEKVRKTDQGQYLCQLYSPTGPDDNVANMKVLVKDPPYFQLTPKLFYQKRLGDNVQMPCVGVGDPDPVILWRKVGSEFPPSARILQDVGNLTIARLTSSDSGTYECIAENSIASIATSTLLIVEATDVHGPYNLSVQTEQTAALLRWHPAFYFALPVAYLIWYRRVQYDTATDVHDETNSRVNTDDYYYNDDQLGESVTPRLLEWNTMRVPRNDTNLQIIHGLDQSTFYEFLVQARCWSGKEFFSQAAFGKTKSEKSEQIDDRSETLSRSCCTYKPEVDLTLTESPSISDDTKGTLGLNPPVNITASHSHDGILLKWSNVHQAYASSIGYKLQYRTVGGWLHLAGPIDSNRTEFLWTTASRGALYQFRIISVELDGNNEGKSSEIIFCETNKNADTYTCNSLRIKSISCIIELFIIIIVLQRCLSYNFQFW